MNGHALLQDVELMPQYQDFGLQSPSRLEAIAQHANEKEANCNHATIMFRFAGDRESNGDWVFGSDRGRRAGRPGALEPNQRRAASLFG
jgi:hypothetical protein